MSDVHKNFQCGLLLRHHKNLDHPKPSFSNFFWFRGNLPQHSKIIQKFYKDYCMHYCFPENCKRKHAHFVLP